MGPAGPPGPSGTPGWIGITQVQWMWSGGLGLGASRAVAADCALDGGFVVLGGGAIAYGAGGDATSGNCHVVSSGIVDAGPAQWRVEGRCDVSVPGGWELYALALCGRVSP
ncbi:MAG TPA: hypothetical protein VND93_13905 [Myxococcales bacterium]|nr:hypothetical protein [Myxococcales bacterium]